MVSTRSHDRTTLAVILLLIAVGWHAWWVTRGWSISGMSGHEFRQAQTALTIHAMKEDGFRLDYSTPILGKPWSIPFEFPVYQYLVARFSPASELGEILTGRTISVVAFYLSLVGLFLALRAVGFSATGAVLALVPVCCAPVYILYTRAVMIESTALCGGAWFLYFVIRYRLERRPWLLAAVLLAGSFAVLAKATTWAVFCLPWALWGLHDLWRARARGWRSIGVVLDDIVLIGVPLLFVGFGWVWITDQIKAMNPIGGFLTSGSLRAFNFGTAAQHLDPAVFHALWLNWLRAVMPGWALIAAVLMLPLVHIRYRLLAAAAFGAFLFGQYVFINLYAIHDYYFYANAWAACLAVGAVAVGLWEHSPSGRWRRWLAVLLVGVVGSGQSVNYHRDLYQIQVSANPGDSEFTTALSKLVAPDEVVVMQSNDWSSMIAYRSHRRMLMIPDSQMFLRPEAVTESIRLLQDERVPLVLFRGESGKHAEWLASRINDFGLEPYPLFVWGDITGYAARDAYSRMYQFLEHEHYHGIVLDPQGRAPSLAAFVAISGTDKAGELPNLEPKPAEASLPYGLRAVFHDGTRYFFAHSPTELHFPIPSGATKVELGYRMDPAVYGKPEFDGVDFSVEVWQPDASPVVLLDERLGPDGDHAPRHTTLSLAGHNRGTLVVRVFPGPTHSNAYDWALIEYLRIR